MEGPTKQQLYAPVSRKGQEMIRASPLTNWTELRSLICSIVNVRADLEGLEAAIERFSATRSAPLWYRELIN